jgi:hypothetical protein
MKKIHSDFTKLFLTGLTIVAMHVLALARTEAADGYEIRIKLTDFKNDTLYLGYQIGNQTFIRDTAYVDKASGFFTFKKGQKLPAGIYLIITPPENNYINIVIGDDDQRFSVVTTTQEPYRKAEVKDSKENGLFFGYMNFIAERRRDLEAAQALQKTDPDAAQKKVTELNVLVKKYQQDIVNDNSKTVTAAFLKTAMNAELPDMSGIKEKEKRDLETFLFFKEHHFDNFDLGNPALLRTPSMFQHVDFYIEKLTHPHPDSILKSLDFIFMKMKPAKETFQYYFLHYFNQYAKTKL